MIIVAFLIAIGAALAAVYAVVNSRNKFNRLEQECQALCDRLKQTNTQQHNDNRKKKTQVVHASATEHPLPSAENHAQQQQKLETDSETDKLRQELQALIHQQQLAKGEAQKQVQQEWQQQLKEHKNAITKLSQELESYKEKQRRREAQERASREALPPELQKLPETVLPQVARIYRKAEQNEKLLALGRGKLQLLQERLSELQKRYFAVCRDLALATTPSDKKNETDNSKKQADKISTVHSHVAATPVAAIQTEKKPTQGDDNKVSAPLVTDHKKASSSNTPKGASASAAKSKPEAPGEHKLSETSNHKQVAVSSSTKLAASTADKTPTDAVEHKQQQENPVPAAS